jgi:predicted S18 family serine protease
MYHLRAVQRASDLRIASQVAADGKQWAELERTRPFHYSAFNLEAMTNIARYAEQVGVDVWHARKQTRGIYNAVAYTLAFVSQPSIWPYKELNGAPEIQSASTYLLRAERAYGSGRYVAALAQIPEIFKATSEYAALYSAIRTPHPSHKTVQERLIWPVK